ncbi:MAG: VWA domain-containing protein [Deltaproteobacteria bacterium]|nr:VWA domain-containing protein [Deltaproteobacteria bacterium]
MKRLLSITFLAACGAGGASQPGHGASSADAGVGGVSFGGQQDIGEFRGIINAGGIPGPNTLDANGFFNEHYAPPPASGCTNPLCLTPGLSVGYDWEQQNKQATLQIAINTNVDPANYPKRPLDLVVVVDHSGSMAMDGRLVKVKSGLDTLIDSLANTDRLAIVEFDDQVQVDAPLTAVSTTGRTQLHQIVAGLTPRGATDIFDGLKAGFDLSVAGLDPTRESRVIFLSDGNATFGNTSDPAILAMADGYVSRGIGLTTIGVGSDFDVLLMRGLAEHGAGNFYFLQDASAATEVFQQELAYFASPIALDIQIDAVAGSGFNFGPVVGSTLWTSSTTAGSMHIPAAFVASRTDANPDPNTGGRRGGGSMLFIAVQPTGNNPTNKVADITLNYREPGTGTIKTQTITLQYPTGGESPSVDAPYLSAPEMAKRYAMYNLFLGLRDATQLTGQPACAITPLQQIRSHAATWNATREDPDIADDISLIDHFIANLQAVGGYGQCGQVPTDYPDGGTDQYPHDYESNAECNAGGSPGWLALVGIALVAVRRRKR